MVIVSIPKKLDSERGPSRVRYSASLPRRVSSKPRSVANSAGSCQLAAGAAWSTIQPANFRLFQIIGRNLRVCERFALFTVSGREFDLSQWQRLSILVPTCSPTNDLTIKVNGSMEEDSRNLGQLHR